MNRPPSPHLTFLFPYKEVSGVPVLFSTLANHLSTQGIRVTIIDFADGYMAQRTKENSAIERRAFETGKPLPIGPDTLLIMQSILPCTMRPELKIDPATRVIFWHLFHHNLVNILLPLPGVRHLQFKYKKAYKFVMRRLLPAKKKSLQTFLETMVKKDALIFYDRYTVETTADFLDLEIRNPISVPLPIAGGSPLQRPGLKNVARLDFAWIGRLADFKMPILLYTLKKVAEYARNKRKRVTFHIIGSGPGVADINRLGISHEFFEIRLAGIVDGEALGSYLRDRVDVVAAMGLSALEGAKLGLPTILLDFSYTPVMKDYKFRWLFDSSQNDLGHYLTGTDYEPGNDSLERMLNALETEYLALSNRTYQYCHSQHDIDSICRIFLESVKRTKLRFGDIPSNICKKGLFRRAYENLRYYKKPKLLAPLGRRFWGAE